VPSFSWFLKPMPGDQVRVLWCLVEGQTTAFKVIVSINNDTDGLKNLVKSAKTPELDDVAADTLVLWKVNPT
jgi:Crinkler effector protein N-terminal domain